VVSAITHTPASGPFELVTTPPMLSAPTAMPFVSDCAGGALVLGRASVRTIADITPNVNNTNTIDLFIQIGRIASLPMVIANPEFRFVITPTSQWFR
jgi:hypothetical protein